ncbi:MAG TPA: hypothetical protein EYH09_00645 [Candidatus Nanopusillus sp.]|nr:hypothetical protein [Candidatus Nanopusillus sp.]HIP90550.1 hypothetical protein [Candidatus Nanopusillus sp.]
MISGVDIVSKILLAVTTATVLVLFIGLKKAILIEKKILRLEEKILSVEEKILKIDKKIEELLESKEK